MTVFQLPVIRSILRTIALFFAKLIDWKVHQSAYDALAEHKKAMIIGAPHTSNWDFLVMLMAALILRMPARWLGKHTLFLGPMGPIMRFLGGIPIDRRARFNSVEQISQKFATTENMILIIAPEGTRSAVAKWRTGFYFMAQAAKVPMVFAYLDYAKREVGVLAIEYAQGDVEQDVMRYQAMYNSVPGKNPQNYGHAES